MALKVIQGGGSQEPSKAIIRNFRGVWRASREVLGEFDSISGVSEVFQIDNDDFTDVSMRLWSFQGLFDAFQQGRFRWVSGTPWNPKGFRRTSNRLLGFQGHFKKIVEVFGAFQSISGLKFQGFLWRGLRIAFRGFPGFQGVSIVCNVSETPWKALFHTWNPMWSFETPET